MEYQMSLIPGEDERTEKRLQLEKNFETVLKQGPVYEDGKLRIFAAYVNLPGKLDLVEFVRNEYGTGGFANDSAMADFNYAGICVKRPEPECQYSWSETVDKIEQLIEREEYLNDSEQEKMYSIVEEYGEAPRPIARYKYPYYSA